MARPVHADGQPEPVPVELPEPSVDPVVSVAPVVSSPVVPPVELPAVVASSPVEAAAPVVVPSVPEVPVVERSPVEAPPVEPPVVADSPVDPLELSAPVIAPEAVLAATEVAPAVEASVPVVPVLPAELADVTWPAAPVVPVEVEVAAVIEEAELVEELVRAPPELEAAASSLTAVDSASDSQVPFTQGSPPGQVSVHVLPAKLTLGNGSQARLQAARPRSAAVEIFIVPPQRRRRCPRRLRSARHRKECRP